MKRILVGVDGSPESRKAAEVAARIARATQSALELAHVIPQIEVPPQDALPGWERTRTERAQMLLHDMAYGMPGPMTGTETSLLEGSPAPRLAEESKRPDIWLVVVGHRGRGGVAQLLLGSVADRLTQLAPKPVLVVR